MNEEVKKRLVIPFMIFVSMMGININSIINGVDNHQPWRIVLASVSTLLFTAMLIVAYKGAKKVRKQIS